MAPNLGWLNVPLGDGSRARSADAVPIAVANEADLGALAEARRGAAVGVDDVVFLSGEVGVGGGIIVDGQPLTGAAGLRRRGRPHAGQPGRHAVPLRLVRLLGDGGGRRGLLLRAGHPRDGGRNEVDAVLREAAAGSRPPWARWTVGRWLGVGLAALVNILNPRLVVLGGRFARIHPFVDRRSRTNSPAGRCRLRAARPRRPCELGVDAPLLGAAELAFEPLLADPAGWLAGRGPSGAGDRVMDRSRSGPARTPDRRRPARVTASITCRRVSLAETA